MGELSTRLDQAVQSSHQALSDSELPLPKGFWKGSRTGLLRPTLASLRPGYDDAESEPVPSVAEPDRRPPHLRAMRINAAQSGSDTDDTLVDSTRLTASTMALSTHSNPDAHPPSPPVQMKPWSESQINDYYLLSRVLNINDVRKPEDLVRPLRNRTAWTAEALWILRPFLYVMALRRWGRRATLPFVLSFVLEYLAKQLRSRSFSPPGLPPRIPSPPIRSWPLSWARTLSSPSSPTSSWAAIRQTRQNVPSRPSKMQNGPNAATPSGTTSSVDPCGTTYPSQTR